MRSKITKGLVILALLTSISANAQTVDKLIESNSNTKITQSSRSVTISVFGLVAFASGITYIRILKEKKKHKKDIK